MCESVPPAPPTIDARVGMRVPWTANIYPVPETVAVPAIKTDKYILVNNRVVPVDPSTGEAVEESVD